MRSPGPPCRGRGSRRASVVCPGGFRPRILRRRRRCSKKTGCPLLPRVVQKKGVAWSSRSEIRKRHAEKVLKQVLTPRSALTCPGSAPEREEGKRHLIAPHQQENSGDRGGRSDRHAVGCSGQREPGRVEREPRRFLLSAQRQEHRHRAALLCEGGKKAPRLDGVPPE